MEDVKMNEEKIESMEYNTKVWNKVTGKVELENVYAYYDEDNDVYCVSDNLLIDDGEIRVEIAFLLTDECKPLGLVYNSYFGDRYDILKSEVPVQQAYNEYKEALAQNNRLDINRKYDNYISANKNFMVLNKKRKQERKWNNARKNGSDWIRLIKNRKEYKSTFRKITY